MRRLLPSLVVLMLLSSAVALRAQEAMPLSELRPGIKVRVEAPGAVAGALTATLLSRTRDSITVGAPNSVPVTIPLSRITRLAISRGKSHSAGAVKGMKWGAAIGLPAGVLVAAVPTDCTECVKGTAAGWIVASVLAGMGYGAGIGALVGSESWADFQLTPNVSSDAGAMRTGLVLRARF